jgi:flagellar protein FliT
MNSLTILNRCDQISNLSVLMLAAARDGDWQEFDRLKQRASGAINEVRVLSATVSLSAEEQRFKLEVLQNILANEGCIQEISEPWLARVSRWLPGSGPSHRRANGVQR